MSEALENAEELRAEARASVQDALADVTALLRKHGLVEGLVQEQVGATPSGAPSELVESGVYKRSKARCSAGSTGFTPPTSRTSSKHCRTTSVCTSGTSSRPSATARSCSRSPTPSASR